MDFSSPTLFSREFIEAQQQSLSRPSRFPFMRFDAKLEAVFEQFRYLRLVKRVPIIGTTGVVLFMLFSVLDYYTLPEAVYQISIPLRLFIICPAIILIMYLAKRLVPARLFMRVYFSVFLVAGAAIVSIIYVSGVNQHMLPYDGILLQLMFGYFLMGLPYMLALYGCLMVSFAYLVMSIYMALPFEQLASNFIFILCLNFIGAIGCYMQERARRFLFLNERLVAIAKAKDKKEIASRTRLVATASHDLRQPLHAMHLLIETLKDQLPEGQVKEIINSLDESTQQLSYLLNSLLDISKLNAGIVEPAFKAVHLEEKIKLFCQEQSLRADEQGIQLNYQGDPSVHVRIDPQLFDRIIRNIMENIYIHSGAKEVDFHWQKEPDGNIKLTLKDDGKGISKEDLETIFDEFQQAKDSARSGMGLGLTIVKQLAELQGLPFGLESEPGKGSCFWLTMEIAHAPQTLLDASKRILCVQFTPNLFLDRCYQLLQQWGYSVQLETIEGEAWRQPLQVLLSEKPDLVLYAVPEDLGLEELQALNDALTHDHDVSIFFVTDQIDTEALNLGRNRVLQSNTKPAKLRMLLEHGLRTD